MREYTLNDVVAAALKLYTVDKIEPCRESILSTLEKNNELPVELAEKAIQTITYGVEMDILRGRKVSSFVKSLYDELVNGIPKSYGVLAKVPNVYEQFKKKNQIAELAFSSKFVGTVGDKLQTSLSVITSRKINWDGGSFISNLAADDDGNLYSFISKAIMLETQYKVKAKIKGHKEDSYNNMAKVTVLNYLKVLSDE